jgi:hypothetical protein
MITIYGCRTMRRFSLASAAAALVLGAAAVVSISASSRAAEPSAVNSTTIRFDVVFSPFAAVATNNVRDASSPFSLGDEIVFHDRLFSKATQVGDDVGSCVIVALTPELLNNCSLVIRLADGTITGQFATQPGPAPKPIALTGGTGAYRNVGGDATLVEFGSRTGMFTLHLLRLTPRS